MNKKFINTIRMIVATVITLSVCFGGVACSEKKLATPTGLTVSESGLITWKGVENADGYVVKINDGEYETSQTSYQVSSVVNDFSCSVKATATKKYADSDYSEVYNFKGTGANVEPPKPAEISVVISGADQIYSGGTTKLSAKVSGTIDVSVTWTVTEGSEYATVDNKGNVTAVEVSGDKLVKVEARSKVDNTAFAEKILTIVAKPDLTQDMLDALNSDFAAFSGYVSIELYDDSSLLGGDKLQGTYNSVIKTSMNGEYWYSEYENGTTGRNTPIYYKNHNNKACQVGVSLMNEEEYFPMKDDFGNEITWERAGLYNSLKNLSVSDFTFDETTWRYVYTGGNKSLVEKVIASANPYDFSAQTFALIIDEGEVSGIYSKSNPDYTIQYGYKAIQHLYAIITVGEDFVEVPTIEKYSHDADHHPRLNEAIENMHNLNSYTVDLTDLNQNLTVGFTESGFTETITQDTVLFKPFSAKTNTSGESVRTYTKNGEYGYKVMRDGLYNAFYRNPTGDYQASRAYEKDISNAKPTFAFAGEIFRGYAYNQEDGSYTYYVDDPMCTVASTFFFGVGNDINLYGIFAARGYTSATDSFTPFVTVKDGYITEACFYYNIGGLIYGVIELKYGDFNTAEIPDEEMPDFETREVPTSWNELEIILQYGSETGEEDLPMNALTFFKENMFAGVSDIEAQLPFFGDVLGDSYGFGLTQPFRPEGSSIAKLSVALYYDVPLDIDYTITSSLNAVKEYLIEEGFTQVSTDTFEKGDIVVVPRDVDLDFMIYVYKK